MLGRFGVAVGRIPASPGREVQNWLDAAVGVRVSVSWRGRAGMKDWDLVYRQEQPPIWNIGTVQPALAEVIKEGGSVRGDVLDAGCGHAELSLELAALGYPVVGIDIAPTALAAATAAAQERGLSNVTFVQDDITSLSGYDARFSTIFDSGMLHSLPPNQREPYLRSMYRAAAPGASFYIMALAVGAFPASEDLLPATFTEDQLRELVSKYWIVEDVRPVQCYSTAAQLPGHVVIAHKEP
jgi:SAM-dependent methyltransferase